MGFKSEFKSGAETSQTSGMRWAQSPMWICGIAFLLRIAWILIGHTYKFKNTDGEFRLRLGDGTDRRSPSPQAADSATPSDLTTGPTAWEPPLYPYLTAAVFLIFGDLFETVGFCFFSSFQQHIALL